MSNPLLNSADDRFKRPTPPAGEKNPFQEKEEALADPSLAPPPQLPLGTYQRVYDHRGTFLAILAVFGLLMELSIVLALTSFSPTWVFLSLAGVVPALTAAVLASGDIAAMRAGAMDPEGLGMTRAAFWLGVGATLLAAAELLAIVTIIFAFLM